MIEHIWTVFCSRAVVDKESNNISIQNVLEQLNIKSNLIHEKGAIPIRGELVSFWGRKNLNEPVKGKSRFFFVSPSNKELIEQDIDVDLQNYERTRNRVAFSGLPIEEFGKHYFKVELYDDMKNKWINVASIPILIKKVDQKKQDNA